MAEKRFVVRLSEDERSTLSSLLKSDQRVAVRKRLHAQILLKVDEGESGPGWSDEKAAAAFDVDPSTVRAVRRKLVEEGFEAALNRKKQARPSRMPLLDKAGEGELLAIAKGNPAKGRARWTLRLLGDELVRLEVVESISHETVRKVLKKTRCNRISK